MRLLLLAVACGLLFLLAGASTGLISAGGFYRIELASVDSGYFSIFDYVPKPIEVYQQMNITAEFTNAGSTVVPVQLSGEVRAANLSILLSSSDIAVTLKPGGRRVFGYRYTPLLSATYWLHAKSVWADGKVTDAWRTAFVNEQTPIYVVIPVPSLGGGGGGGGGVPGGLKSLQPRAPRLEATYPRVVNVAPGRTVLVPIDVRNAGTLVTHNVAFYLTGSGLVADVSPGGSFELRVNQTLTFVVELQAPESANGSYPYEFTAASDEGSVIGKFTVVVGSQAPELALEDEFGSCRFQFRLFEEQLHGLPVGRSAPSAELALRKLSSLLNETQAAMDAGNAERALQLLNGCSGFLKQAALDISLARAPPMPFTVPGAVSLSTFLVLSGGLAGALLIIILLVYRRREKKRRSVVEARMRPKAA